MKLFFLLLFFISQTLFSQEEQKRIALVIGNDGYLYGNSLKNPVNDADLMANTLTQLKFKVIKHSNIKLKQLNQAIINFSQKLNKYDVVLFYYAGHGVQIDGTNYLIPVDARPYIEADLRFEAISLNKIVREFEYNTNSINIVILDACRDNPFRSWTRGRGTGLKAMKPPSGTIISFATSEGETAADGSNKNSLFTLELCKQMKTPQRIEDVFINTRIAVENASKGIQSPQEWSKLRGKFYFKKADSTLFHPEISISKNNKTKSSLNINSRFFTNSRSDVIMIDVQGGFFQIGSQNGKNDEFPVHKVELDNFCLSKYEITNEQYCKFLNYIGCGRKGKHKGIQYINMKSSFCEIEYHKGRFYSKQGKKKHPVVEVSWYGANAYCKWMGGRLPTEAEWEYAAGGSVETLHATSLQNACSNNLDEVAWYNKNSRAHSHPVGQKKTNAFGFYDMLGNIIEWCADWYEKDYYSISPVINPENTRYSKYKTLRGGSWKNSAYSCRPQTRFRLEPEKSARNIGFRVCMSKKKVKHK